ncbi:MAG: glycosyltransferase family 39 protein [Clostridia bacterium]|nr:glycosyltransferase family 39 protein [Clostridia bacterium]
MEIPNNENAERLEQTAADTVAELGPAAEGAAEQALEGSSELALQETEEHAFEDEPGHHGDGGSPKHHSHKQHRVKKLLSTIIRISAIAAAAGWFAYFYFFTNNNYKLLDLAAPLVTLALFVCIVFIFVPKLVDTLFGSSGILEVEREIAPRAKRNFLIICLAALGIHILAGLVGTLIFKYAGKGVGSNAGLLDIWRTSWMKTNTDAGHYINIAQNWYVKEGNDRLLIVFFPMFPLLIRFFNIIINNSFYSAQLINAVATSLASGMIYLTMMPIIGSSRSKVAAFTAILLPGMIFMNSPMSEPLFLLFTICALFFTQRKRFILAGIFTALAGFTRSLGVLSAVPLAILGIGHVVRLRRERLPFLPDLIVLVISLIISTFGTLGYLYINYSIHGDALKFFEFQSTNWYQNASPFFDTPRYMIHYSQMYLQKGEVSKFVSLWLPGFIAIFGSLLLIGAKARRMPAIYTAYFLSYFAVAIGCTWLLSAMRYISAAFPVTAAIAHSANRKWKTALLFVILGGLYIANTYMYMARMEVY